MATIRHQQPHPNQPGLIWDAMEGRFKPSGRSTVRPELSYPGARESNASMRAVPGIDALAQQNQLAQQLQAPPLIPTTPPASGGLPRMGPTGGAGGMREHWSDWGPVPPSGDGWVREEGSNGWSRGVPEWGPGLIDPPPMVTVEGGGGVPGPPPPTVTWEGGGGDFESVIRQMTRDGTLTAQQGLILTLEYQGKPSVGLENAGFSPEMLHISREMLDEALSGKMMPPIQPPGLQVGGASQEELAEAALARQNQLTQQLQAPPLTPPGVGSPADQLTQQLQTPALEGVSESPTLTRFAADPVTAQLAAGIPPDRSFFNGNPNIVFDATTGRYVPSNPYGGASREELAAANATLTDDTIPPGSDIIPPGSDIIPPGGDIIPPGGDIIPPGGDIIPPGGDIIPPGGAGGPQPDTPTPFTQVGGTRIDENGHTWVNQGLGKQMNTATGEVLTMDGAPVSPPTFGEEFTPPGAGPEIPPPVTPGPFTDHEDVKGMVTDLINGLLAQGELNAESFNDLLGQINSLLDFTVGKGSERDSLQKEMIKMLVDATLPGLQEAMDRANEGLSPEARAAMETRAIEDPARLRREGQALITTQLQRADPSAGQIPGAVEPRVREFGRLAADEAAMFTEGMTGVAIADQEQRVLSRQQALEAAQITSGLLGTAGSLLDPSAFLATTANLLGISQNTLANFTHSQNTALQTIGDLLRTRADLEPEALKGIIASGLLQSVPGFMDSLHKWFPNLGNKIKELATDEAKSAAASAPEGVVGAAVAKIFGAKLGALLVNPWFWGPAAVGGMALLVNHFVGQGRKAADTWVFDIQKPFSDQLERINQGVDLPGSGAPRAEDALRQLSAIAEYWNQGASALAAREGRFPEVIQDGVKTMTSLWDATWKTYLKEAGRPNDPIPPLRAA